MAMSVFVCMYVCMYACMYVYVCMYVCMYVLRERKWPVNCAQDPIPLVSLFHSNKMIAV